MELNNLELPEKGRLYRVKRNTIKRKTMDRYRRPIKQGWELVISPRRTLEVYPNEVFMVVSGVKTQQLEMPGQPLRTYWIFDFLHKDRLYEDIWFTPVKWHVMVEKVETGDMEG